MRLYRPISILVLILLSGSGCFQAEDAPEKSEVSSQTASTSSTVGPKIPADKSLLKVKMHDFPLDGKEVSKVLIDLQEVQFINSTGEKFIVSQAPVELDLLTLVNSMTALIGEAIIPMGSYEQIRLVLGPNNRVVANDKEEPLKVPSGEQSGLKISGSFNLRGGRITEIQLDFDAQKSVSFNQGQGYMLKPVIKISSVASLSSEQEQKIVQMMGSEAEEMFRLSEIVVQAVVNGVEKTEMELSRIFHEILPYSYWGVSVEDVIKGDPDAQTTIRVVGGQAPDGLIVDVSDAPHFDAGERSIIFLRTGTDGNLAVTGADEGKIDL